MNPCYHALLKFGHSSQFVPRAVSCGGYLPLSY